MLTPYPSTNQFMNRGGGERLPSKSGLIHSYRREAPTQQWMDEIHFAPPKKPSGNELIPPVNTNKPWLLIVSWVVRNGFRP